MKSHTYWKNLWLASALILVLSIFGGYQLYSRLNLQAEIQESNLHIEANAKSIHLRSEVSSYSDFTLLLTNEISSRKILARLGDTENNDVVFTTVQESHTPATRDQLPRTELTIALRGSYPSIKKMLASLLDQSQGTTLSYLSMRKTSASNDITAASVVRVWGRPLESLNESTDQAILRNR